MSPQFRLRFVHFVCFASLCAATQAIAQPFDYPSCKPPDIQTSLHFYQAPQGDQVVAVEYRNIGNWTCVLAPFDTNSEKDIHLGGYFIPVEIAKGNAVHSSFRWHAEAPEPGINCDPLYTLPFLDHASESAPVCRCVDPRPKRMFAVEANAVPSRPVCSRLAAGRRNGKAAAICACPHRG